MNYTMPNNQGFNPMMSQQNMMMPQQNMMMQQQPTGFNTLQQGMN